MTVAVIDRVALILIALATGWLGRHQPPTADDWSILVHVRAVPDPFVFAAGQYRDWSGRFLPWTILGVLWRSPDVLPWLSIGFGILLCLVAGPWLRATGWREPPGSRARTDWVAAAALVLGLRFTIGQSVFWAANGVTYFLVCALGLGWWTVQRRGVPPALLRGVPGTVAWCAASLALGLGHELLDPVLLLASAGLAWKRRTDRREMTGFRMAGLAGLAAGTVLLVIAPGNAARAREFQPGFPHDPLVLFRNFRDLVAPCFAAGLPALCWGFAAGFLLGTGPRPRPADVLRPVILLLLAASTMTPLAAAPAFAVSRAYFPAALLLFAAGAWQGAVVRAAAGSTAQRAVPAAVRIVTLAIFVLWAAWAAGQVRAALPFSRSLTARGTQLDRLRNSLGDVTLAPVPAPVPSGLYLDDLRPDAQHWINRAVARWYGLRSVRLGVPDPGR